MEETALSTFSFNVMEKNIPVFFFLLLLSPNNFRYKVINIVAYQGKHFEKKKKKTFLIGTIGCSSGIKMSVPSSFI